MDDNLVLLRLLLAPQHLGWIIWDGNNHADLSMRGYLYHRNWPMVNYMDTRVQILRHWTSIKLVISIQTLRFLLTVKAGLWKLMFRDRQGGSFSGTPTAGFSGQRKSQGLRGRYQDWTHNIVLRYLARRIFVLRHENIVLRYYAGYYWYQINISIRYQSWYHFAHYSQAERRCGSRRDRKLTIIYH